MANTKSAIKRIDISEKRRVRNAAVKSATRTYVKKARTAIQESAEESQAALREAVAALDIAVRKGVLHANNASRRKSRLMKAFNAAVVAAAAPQVAEEAAPAKRASKSRKTTTKGRTAAKPRAAAKPKAEAAPAVAEVVAEPEPEKPKRRTAVRKPKTPKE
jgi:small subunit ribosomal protein S20